jgi:hypothetical protein
MEPEEIEDFSEYLRNCTDRQVLNIHEEEGRAGREGYAALARNEAIARGMTPTTDWRGKRRDVDEDE